jgi:hypothetical protein
MMVITLRTRDNSQCIVLNDSNKRITKCQQWNSQKKVHKVDVLVFCCETLQVIMSCVK